MTDEAKDQAVLRIQLLGGFSLKRNGREVALPSYAKGRALLAYLCAEPGRRHARSALAGLLWPELPENAARSNLRLVLAELRALLDTDIGASSFLTDKSAIEFRPAPDCHVDCIDFSALLTGRERDQDKMEKAIGLYRGEFLTGFSLANCPEFESWLQIKREALHRAALAMLAALADTHEKGGGFERALMFSLRSLELDAWNEAALCSALRLYAVMERKAAAIKLYQDFACRLHDELGIQPGDSARSLFESITRGNSIFPHQPARAHAAAFPLPAPAERRQVTVLYCELTCATDDPEDAADRLQAPQLQSMHVIRRNGGYVSHVHGSRLLAYFGYPAAQENAARIAALTALELSRAAPLDISVRFSLHTGLIVTSADSAAPDVAGLTSSAAIRLRDVPGAGEIVVSAATHALIAGHFTFQALGRHKLEGMRRSMPIYTLLGESGAFSRLDAADELAPFVGRRAELERLRCLYRATCRDGGVHCVWLHGEAGIGKSRLLRHFIAPLADASIPIRIWLCSEEHQGETFHPLKSDLAKACGFAPGDDDAAKQAKLASFFGSAQGPLAPEKVAPLARLFSSATEERDTVENRNALFALLLEMLRNAPGASLLVVEDLQWADASTLDLLEKLLTSATQSAAHGLLVLISARSDFPLPWSASAASLEIPPLCDEESSALADYAFGAKHPQAETVARIVHAADGVPLFIEEIARMLRDDTPAAEHPSSIPASLRDLLMARLDRQMSAKPVAQAAAAIGREFGVNLLAAATGHPPTLDSSLEHLEKAGLIMRRGFSLPPRYRFKHALIQESAYLSLARASRREIHSRIAQALTAHSPVEDALPEMIASHYFRAEKFDDAAHWGIIAGKTALARCAYGETALHCRRALEAIAAMPPGGSRDAAKLHVLLIQGAALIAVKGYGAPEVGSLYAEALALSQRTGAVLELFRATWGLFTNCSSHATHRDAMELALELLRLAQQIGRDDLLIAAHSACTITSFYLGHFDDARRHLEETRHLYRPEFDEVLLALFGEHARVTALAFGVWLYWIGGQPRRALELSDEALLIARRLGHPNTLCFALCSRGIFHQQLDEHQAVGNVGREIAAVAVKHSYALWQVIGEIFQGWEQAADGQEQGLARIAAAIDIMRAGVYQGGAGFFLKMLADAYGKLGRHAEQLHVIEGIIALVALKHDHYFDAELLRTKGECLLNLGDYAQAEICITQALELARIQGAGTLARRAADSLGEMWRSRGDRERADNLHRETCEALPNEPESSPQGILCAVD